MDFSVIARRVKEDSYEMANTSESLRDQALASVATALSQSKELIFAANAKDLERATRENLPGPVVARLKFNEAKLTDTLSGIQNLIALPDPLVPNATQKRIR
jgi:glutamate-5-semialdehyde dehydrogenase